jgi:hypothetical protein
LPKYAPYSAINANLRVIKRDFQGGKRSKKGFLIETVFVSLVPFETVVYQNLTSGFINAKNDFVNIAVQGKKRNNQFNQ